MVRRSAVSAHKPVSLRTPRSVKTAQKKFIKRQVRQSQSSHKRVLLHPIAVMVLLCTIVLVANWTYTALADTTISSRILAPSIKTGAIITSPSHNTTVTTQTPIIVSGTCPAESYVALNVNDTFTGVDLCDSDGRFSVQTNLFSGTNTLSAQDYNVSNQAGPASKAVTVNSKTSYASALTGSQNSASSSAVTTAPPLLLTSAFEWKTFQAGTTFAWDMDVEGGVPPYTVRVDWGDNQISTYTFPIDPTFTISHVYGSSGYFAIKAVSVDARSNQHSMQLAALINPKHGNSTFFSTHSSESNGTGGASPMIKRGEAFIASSKVWLWIAWPSLGVVALMMFSFWLGELQDRRKLFVRFETSSARHRH